MGNLLQSLSKTVHASVGLTILLFFGLHFFGDGFVFDRIFWSWLARYTHVIVATMWIGLLWYLNFVQIPNMSKIPDEQKPAISKVIAPAVLFYFRWAAAITVLSGLVLAWLNGYVHQAMTLGIGSGFGKECCNWNWNVAWDNNGIQCLVCYLAQSKESSWNDRVYTRRESKIGEDSNVVFEN
tara:strand:+ start:108 stop:653 length:546 start_codon:yes stop_codon:yes gene_type:complete